MCQLQARMATHLLVDAAMTSIEAGVVIPRQVGSRTPGRWPKVQLHQHQKCTLQGRSLQRTCFADAAMTSLGAGVVIHSRSLILVSWQMRRKAPRS